MRDDVLLQELLEADNEAAVIKALESRDLLKDKARWRHVGDIPNNQSVVQAQQSFPVAALVEKFTNAVDAVLLRRCKTAGMDPRGAEARATLGTMSDAVEHFFGDIATKPKDDVTVRKLAEENLVLYATGTKERPCIALYDAGEGQFAQDFPTTFCSLIKSNAMGSYKGAIPFVQGRFNMGGTGVLPFCSEKYKLQLIVSRVPSDMARGDAHEWAFTLFAYFRSPQDPAWKYLVGPDALPLTAGNGPLGLVPLAKTPGAGEALKPRERKVTAGTLIKLYDYKAPKSNICGELYRKLEEFLLQPALPLRLVECRPEYSANVMANTIWDAPGKWKANGWLEKPFEDGASITIDLDNGESIPGQIRIFNLRTDKSTGKKAERDDAITGLVALINGQAHASRPASFFATQKVDKEHVASSMLVTLDCSDLGEDSRSALFMANRETFRDDPLLKELLAKLQKELHDHEGVDALNKQRYAEKIKNAVSDDDGISALEELLSTDPLLADLFGSEVAGRTASKTSTNGAGTKVPGVPLEFKGLPFPTFVARKDGTKDVSIEIPQGDVARATFFTDAKNDYFTRKRLPGHITVKGGVAVPSHRLFEGRLTMTCTADKAAPIDTRLNSEITITDKKGSGPFNLNINATITPPRPPPPPRKPAGPKKEKDPMVDAGPSRPNIQELDQGPDSLPAKVEKDAETGRLQIVINTTSKFLEDAKNLRKKEEEPAVKFVYTYGLALVVMGLLDAARQTDDWKNGNDAKCREQIAHTATGVARVIVPLCLSLPKNLPKAKK
jgi:hypothetical protein